MSRPQEDASCRIYSLIRRDYTYLDYTYLSLDDQTLWLRDYTYLLPDPHKEVESYRIGMHRLGASGLPRDCTASLGARPSGEETKGIVSGQCLPIESSTTVLGKVPSAYSLLYRISTRLGLSS